MLGVFQSWLGTTTCINRTIPSLLTITFSEITNGLDKGLLTLVHLVQAYLKKITKVNHEFNAVIGTNHEALQIAQELDKERATTGHRGKPLHGVPIIIKDHIMTLHSMNSTCGSYTLVGARPKKESAVVTAMRRAGIIILRKANLAQWSGGQATGVYYPGMKASGSSTGSALGTALGLFFVSLRTETSYSIVSLAEKSGVVGFKPTRELVFSKGIMYASYRQDTIGTLTRTVEDARIIVQELIQHSANHNIERSRLSPNLCRMCSGVGLHGIRIGVTDNFSELRKIHCVKRAAFKKTISLLKNAVADIVEAVEILGADEYEKLPQASKDVVLHTKLKAALNSYLSDLETNPQGIKDLRDLINFTKTHPKEKYPQRNVEVLAGMEATKPNEDLYLGMLKKDAYFFGEGGIASALARHKLQVSAKAGSPAMSLPMGVFPPDTEIERNQHGFVEVAPNIPLSLYIFGGVKGDEDFPRVGHAFERLSRVRDFLTPLILPRTDFADTIGLCGT
ncbi:amidase signature domain-containing protein [Clohesyomyces aquaticus]|uniref:Amidase signature domain-containing protein n=1 Tax=Clohesyomyces aquaticus TaxID=1231657 RepID=A0A1Y1ZVG2_9PLEO|nr:amidase signature domain-containing protein [Clohesyomyces aquaticus]